MILKKQTFLKQHKKIIAAFALLIIASVCARIDTSFYYKTAEKSVSATVNNVSEITVVVDAGHGGEDGGAVGINGVLEKDINLSISNYLCAFFDFLDINAVPTRTEDRLLYTPEQSDRKKFNDLNNRLLFTNSVENPIFISIHQNKFPVEKYYGLQVYYSVNNSESFLLSELIQQKNAEFLQPENNRQVKKAGRNIFLLHRLNCPAVLVECGFLSNSNEEQLLSDSGYQKKLAFIIFSSVMDYLNSNG